MKRRRTIFTLGRILIIGTVLVFLLVILLQKPVQVGGFTIEGQWVFRVWLVCLFLLTGAGFGLDGVRFAGAELRRHRRREAAIELASASFGVIVAVLFAYLVLRGLLQEG